MYECYNKFRKYLQELFEINHRMFEYTKPDCAKDPEGVIQKS
jgi:hypothetical protein